MRAKIVFQDNTWCIARRINFWEGWVMPETQGAHHWIIEDCGNANYGGEPDKLNLMDVGNRVAIPISSMKYCVFLK